MASLEEYLRNPNAPYDPNNEALARNLSQYVTNKQVLESLGQKDQSNPAMGLLDAILKPLSVPGNLVRAGIAEATGVANRIPQLSNVSGARELAGLLRGDIRVGTGDIPALRTVKGESNLARLPKLALALTGDIATDPLSYLGAPASISRKTASVNLVNHIISNPKILDEIVSKSNRGSTLIDELVSATPQSRMAELQKELKVAAEKGTPIDVANKVGRINLANEQLANYLAEGLYAEGRAGLINRLAILTGDKTTAEQLFTQLPESIKGGIILTTPWGTPLKNPDGKYVRLTSGNVQYPGKAAINKAKMIASELPPASLGKRWLSGKGGSVYANATRGIALEQEPVLRDILKSDIKNVEKPINEFATRTERARFVDYVNTKEASALRTMEYQRLQGRARAVIAEAGVAAEKFKGDNEYKQAFEDSFFSPWSKPSFDVMTEAQKAGWASGEKVRNQMINLFDEARAIGIDIGQIGTKESYSPVMYTDAYIERLMKSEKGRIGKAQWDSTIGKDSHIAFVQKIEEAQKKGFPLNPDNPNIIALDAREINRLEGVADMMETDPLKVFTKYSALLSNRIATKKFLDKLVETGVGFFDMPTIDTAVTRLNSAVLQSIASKAVNSPEVQKLVAKELKAAKAEVYKYVKPEAFNELKKKISERRSAIKNFFDARKAQYDSALNVYDSANRDVNKLYKEAVQSDASIRQLQANLSEADKAVKVRESVANSLRARVGRLNKKSEQELLNSILQETNAMTPEGERQYIQSLIAEFNADPTSTVNQLKRLTLEKSNAQAELDAAREARKTLLSQNRQTNTIAIDNYVAALEKRNNALVEVNKSKQLLDEARKQWVSVKDDIKLERLKTIRTVMRSYRDALYVKSEYILKQKNKLMEMKRAGATDAEILAEKKTTETYVKAMTEDIRAKRKVFESLIKIRSGKFGKDVQEYGTALLNATKDLSRAEYDAFQVLTAESQIQKFIDIIATNSRSSQEVLDAMGNLKKTYDSIRSKIPDKFFDKLSTSEKKLIEYYDRFSVSGDIRKKGVASELGVAMGELGITNVALTPSTTNFFANHAITKWLEDIYHTEKNPSSWKKFIEDVLDPLQAIWKQTITTGRGPGFIATNLIGGMFMNYQGGVTLKDMALAFDTITSMRKILSDINAKYPGNALYTNQQLAAEELEKKLSTIKIGNSNAGQLFKEFIARGGFDDTETNFFLRQIEKGGLITPERFYKQNLKFQENYHNPAQNAYVEKYRNYIDFLTSNKLQTFLNDMNQSAELYMRFGAFISGYKEYGNFKSAMNKVYLLHFNYQDLSKAEDAIRRIVPFYTWTRNNIPAQLRSLAMQPGKIQKAMYLNENFKNYYGTDDTWVNAVLPEYMANSGGFFSRFTFGDGNQLGFFNKMPFQDINRIIQVNDKMKPSIRGGQALQMLGPVGIPMQVLSNVDYMSGMPIQAETQVPGYYNLFRLAQPLTGVRNTPEGTVMSGQAALALRNAVPILGIGERAVSGINALLGGNLPGKDVFLSKNQQNTGVSGLLNTTGLANIVGYGTTTSTAKSKSGVIYGKTLEQQKQISRAANDLGIDTQEIRDLLRQGYTPAEVASMIGAGQVPKVDTKKLSDLTDKQRRKVDNAINILNSP